MAPAAERPKVPDIEIDTEFVPVFGLSKCQSSEDRPPSALSVALIILVKESPS